MTAALHHACSRRQHSSREQAPELTVMEVSMVMLRAYDRTRPKVDAFPRCSTVRRAAARAAMAPRVSSLTLSHLGTKRHMLSTFMIYLIRQPERKIRFPK